MSDAIEVLEGASEWPVADGEVLRSIEVTFHAAVDFGHGQNTGVGWSDPTSLPRKPWRSLQPTS